MKILVLSYEYPPIGGGGGVICKELSERLVKLGHNATVITSHFNGLPKKESQNDVEIIRVEARRKKIHISNPYQMLKWHWAAKAYLLNSDQKFDVCMAHFVIPGGLTANFIKKKLGVPFIAISHGHDIPWVHRRKMFLGYLIAYFHIKKILKNSSQNLLQSKEMKMNADQFLGIKLASKNLIIKNGIGNEFVPSKRNQSDKLQIIFSGRLVLQKDPITFLKAINILSNGPIKFEVHILGDGYLRNKIERFITKNNLSSLVKVYGKVNKEQVISVLQNSDVFVSTSLNEGMSISMMEAAACGLFLISTKVSGSSEIVFESYNGKFIDFENPKLIANKIEDYYEHKFLKGFKIDDQFLRRFQENNNWDNRALEYNQVLKSVVK